MWGYTTCLLENLSLAVTLQYHIENFESQNLICKYKMSKHKYLVNGVLSQKAKDQDY